MREVLAKNKNLAWLSLLVYLLAGSSSVSWCLADAGYCGIEAPLLSCCAPEARKAAGCGPCVDIDLGFPSLKSNSRSSRGPVSQYLPPSLPAPAEHPLRSVLLSPAGRTLIPGPSPALLQLRTVVLLV